MTPNPAKPPRSPLSLIGRLVGQFDRADAHFYLGLALMFAGLARLFSTGVALAVCGGLLCAVGLMGALFSAAPTAPGGPQERR